MKGKKRMTKITIDGKEYETDNLSDNAKAQLASLQFNEVHMNRLRNELAIADTARMAYSAALKKELGDQKGSKKTSKD
tara:strand:- start:18 stop:251 length:234 start_codon:yes stop_codon:yes gene_type:complete